MREALPYAGVYAFAWPTYLASISLSIAKVQGWVEPNVGNLGLLAQGSIVSLIFALAAVGHLRERERLTRKDLLLVCLIGVWQPRMCCLRGRRVVCCRWESPHPGRMAVILHKRFRCVVSGDICSQQCARSCGKSGRDCFQAT